MNTSRMIPMLAVGGAMTLGASTHAGSPDALLVLNKTDAKAQAMGLLVCNIYARFSEPESILLSVGFVRMITQDGSDFWQHPEADSETAPFSFLFDFFPDLVYDTFVTIGVKTSDEAPGGRDGTSLDADYNNFGNAILGGWFNNSPFNGQGTAGTYDDLGMGDGKYYILIAQLTTFSDGPAVVGVEGSLRLYRQDEDGEVHVTDVSFEHSPVLGDLDGDGDVDPVDLVTLLGNWGPCGECTYCFADLDGDCVVGPIDLAILLANWG